MWTELSAGTSYLHDQFKNDLNHGCKYAHAYFFCPFEYNSRYKLFAHASTVSKSGFGHRSVDSNIFQAAVLLYLRGRFALACLITMAMTVRPSNRLCKPHFVWRTLIYPVPWLIYSPPSVAHWLQTALVMCAHRLHSLFSLLSGRSLLHCSDPTLEWNDGDATLFVTVSLWWSVHCFRHLYVRPVVTALLSTNYKETYRGYFDRCCGCFWWLQHPRWRLREGRAVHRLYSITVGKFTRSRWTSLTPSTKFGTKVC